ncbi:hypothetical protein BKA81DRAFT_376406 [Phyllosticta paracitricarpa]
MASVAGAAAVAVEPTVAPVPSEAAALVKYSAEKDHWFAYNSDCELCAKYNTYFDKFGVGRWIGEATGFRLDCYDDSAHEKVESGPHHEVLRLKDERVGRGTGIFKMSIKIRVKVGSPVEDGSSIEDDSLIEYRDTIEDHNPMPRRCFIFMEESEGNQLSKLCGDLDLKSQAKVASEIMEFEKGLAALWLSWHGSLFRKCYEDHPPQHLQPAKVVNEVPEEVVKRAEYDFYIGPSQEFRLWEAEREKLEDYHGPWASASDYVKTLLRCEIDLLSKHAGEDQDGAGQSVKRLQCAPQVCVELLQKASSVVQYIMPKDDSITASRVRHLGLSLNDIFVDKDLRIETVMGWRGAWAGPAFAVHAPPPAFDIGGHDMLNHPEEFLAQLKPEVSEEEFDRSSQQLLARSDEYKQATNNAMWSLIHVAIKTQEFGILPTKHFLIQVQRNWDRFDAQDPCPYDFTEDEIRQHVEEFDGLDQEGEDGVKRACLQATRWV